LKRSRKPTQQKNNEIHYVGNNIRAQEVMCIDSSNTNHGVISISKALEIAKDNGLQLIQVVPKKGNSAPICKVLDYSKFKYENQKREKAQQKKQRESAVKLKEIKFRPSTDKEYLEIKAKQVQSFIDDNNRVKVSVVFKGRQMSHKEVGEQQLKTFLDMLEHAEFMSDPQMFGRQMTVMITKKASSVVS